MANSEGSKGEAIWRPGPWKVGINNPAAPSINLCIIPQGLRPILTNPPQRQSRGRIMSFLLRSRRLMVIPSRPASG